jgi:hypothetical protein
MLRLTVLLVAFVLCISIAHVHAANELVFDVIIEDAKSKSFPLRNGEKGGFTHTCDQMSSGGGVVVGVGVGDASQPVTTTMPLEWRVGETLRMKGVVSARFDNSFIGLVATQNDGALVAHHFIVDLPTTEMPAATTNGNTAEADAARAFDWRVRLPTTVRVGATTLQFTVIDRYVVPRNSEQFFLRFLSFRRFHPLTRLLFDRARSHSLFRASVYFVV